MESNRLTEFMILFTFLLYSSARITWKCMREDDFNEKFVEELRGLTFAQAMSNQMKPSLDMPTTNLSFRWVDKVSGETTVVVETCPAQAPQLKFRLNDIEHRVQLADNPHVVPLIGCTEVAVSKEFSQEDEKIEMLVAVKPHSDTRLSPLSKPVFKDREPLQKLGVYLGMAEAVSSIHQAGVVHGAIDSETFGEIDFETHHVKMRNFHYAGIPGTPWDNKFTLRKPLECKKHDCSLAKPLDIYMLALTIAMIEFDKDELYRIAYRLHLHSKKSNSDDESEFLPLAIEQLSKNNPVMEYPNAEEDNLSKILQAGLKADRYHRCSSNEFLSRLTDVFNRSKSLLPKRSEDKSAVNIAENNNEAKKLDEGQAKNLLNSGRSNTQPINQDTSDQQNFYRSITIGVLVFFAAAIPIGFCVFKKRSSEHLEA